MAGERKRYEAQGPLDTFSRDLESVYSALSAEGKWTLNLDVQHGSPAAPSVDAVAKRTQQTATPSRRLGFHAE
jgi:hypothetical protein